MGQAALKRERKRAAAAQAKVVEPVYRPLFSERAAWGLEAGAAAFCIFLFVVLKAYGLYGAAGDENIYFYMAKRTWEGVLPYRDFFFAHPPLHLLPAVILYGVLGFNLHADKMLPMFAAFVAALFVWRAARKMGRAEGIVALAAFLFCRDVLRASSHFTGVNWTALWLAAGLWALSDGRDRLAGILFAAGGMTGLYAIPTAGAMCGALWLVDRKRGWRAGLWWVCTFWAAQLLMFAIFHAPYVDQSWLYHFKKPRMAGAFSSSIASIAYMDIPLLWSGIPALAALACDAMGLLRPEKPARDGVAALATRAEWAKPRRLIPLVCLSAVVVDLIFVATLARVYSFYYQILFVSCGPLAGYGYTAIGRALGAAARTFQRPEGSSRLLAAAVLAAVAVTGDFARASGADMMYPARYRGMVQHFQWRDAPLIGGTLNGLVKSIFWNPDRIIGARLWSIPTYLQHEARPFIAVDEMAAAIEQDNLPGTLFGDSTSAGLVALETHRRLALDEADTNALRFRSEISPIEPFLARMKNDLPAYVIFSEVRGIGVLEEAREWAAEHYTLLRTINDPTEGPYLLYRRRD